MQVDETAALAEVLKAYQRDSASDSAEAKLAIALTRVVEQRVRPGLQKKLKPQDVDDVCSEVILGFWKFRHSVRPDEVGKLVHTLIERKRADQLRDYYYQAEHRAAKLTASEHEVLDALPASSGDPGTDASQQAWEMLNDTELSAQDRLVAYTLALGAEKKLIAEVLGINVDTVTASLKRCKQALARRRQSTAEKAGDA